MRAAAAVTALFLTSRLMCAQSGGEDKHDHSRHKMQTEGASQNESPIKITINPETRVSVMLAGPLPPPARCGTAAELMVKIVNRGFMTAKLEAEFVDDPPFDASLDFLPDPLKGIPEELRKLRITLRKPGPTDLTIAFRAKNGISDLGGRDRIHFLIRCI